MTSTPSARAVWWAVPSIDSDIITEKEHTYYENCCPPQHTAGTVNGRDHSLVVAGGYQPPVPLPLAFRPAVRLGGAGDGGLQCHIRIALPQGQYSLAEIQVAALGHAAEEMAVSLFVGDLHRVPDAPLQHQAPGVLLPVAPGQLGRTVAGEAAAALSPPHEDPPFVPDFCFHCRTFVPVCKEGTSPR